MRDNYGVPRRVSSETFVGRTAELGLLEGVLERAAAGRPAFAFVGGESGVGKTRLLREFEARARALDARVLLGQCLELGGAQIPYAPLVAALRPLARGLDAAESERLPEATRNALAELLPELGGAETRADEELKARQGRLFEAILALLERLGRGGPVLLAIEDLHWADGSTRDFITFLVRSAREERLCLVVTYRSDELHRRHPLRPLLAELERATGVERITLERFDRGELDEQLAGILLQAAPEALAQRLFDRSQGNPLFTEELLAATEDGDGWMLPETLRDVLLARVERLAPATQAVVRATAVLDRPITHGLLEAVSGLAPAEVMEGAREAVAHQVLDRFGRHVPIPSRARRRGGPQRPAARGGHGAARPRRGGAGARSRAARRRVRGDRRRRAGVPLARRPRAEPLARGERAGRVRSEARVRVRGGRASLRACARAVGARARRRGACRRRPRGAAAPGGDLRDSARRGVARDRADPRSADDPRRNRGAGARRCCTCGSATCCARPEPGARASPPSTARSSCCRRGRATSARGCWRSARAWRCCSVTTHRRWRP